MTGPNSAEKDAGLIVRRLTAERSQAGMSMRAVARLADVSPSTVHDWEHGIKEPTLSNLRDWASALGFGLALVPLTTVTSPGAQS